MNERTHIFPGLGTVTPVSKIELGSSNHLEQSAHQARSFIRFFEWGNIVSEFLGAYFDGILSVFFLGSSPAATMWTVGCGLSSGTFPPPTSPVTTPKIRTKRSMAISVQWRNGFRRRATARRLPILIPVNVPATPANAALLDSRLKFLDAEILPLPK